MENNKLSPEMTIKKDVPTPTFRMNQAQTLVLSSAEVACGAARHAQSSEDAKLALEVAILRLNELHQSF